MTIFRLIRILNVIPFLIVNEFYSLKMDDFETIESEHYVMEPLKRKDIMEVFKLFKKLNNGLELSLDRKILLMFSSTKFCYILRSQDGEIFGMGLYYFNKRDVKEKTIHEGYIGLTEKFRGIGIGTEARKNALKHFAKFKFLKGVSSRITLDNTPSLKGNINLGFEIKEKYWDKKEGKERTYLVCNLDIYRQINDE